MSYQAQNQSYLSRSIAFHEQQPLSMERGLNPAFDPEKMIPGGAAVQEDQRVALSFYAPSASSVTAAVGMELQVPLEKQANGLWLGQTEPLGPGFRPVSFFVDGVEVLNPMAPLGYGACRPMNCVDVPDPQVPEADLTDIPHGTVSREYYKSRVTGRFESCLIYTPAEYSCSGKAYPVLYLQHGHGENENCWVWQGKVNFILDTLIHEKKAVPMIVVMNDGMVTRPDPIRGRVLDAPVLEEMLLRDCIPFVESRYRVLPGKENRAMAGLSMGSMQTSLITLKHPELFAYAGIFSGFMHNLMRVPEEREVHLDAPSQPDFRQRYRVFYRAMGETDPFLQHFLDDDAMLEAQGLTQETWPAYTRRILPGSHEWRCWRICIKEFAQLIFR